jgi:hypothetical protein
MGGEDVSGSFALLRMTAGTNSSACNKHCNKDLLRRDGNEDGWARVQEVGRRFLDGVHSSMVCIKGMAAAMWRW